MRKRFFRYVRTAKAQITLRIRAGQGFRCPQTESLDTFELLNRGQCPDETMRMRMLEGTFWLDAAHFCG